MDEIVKPAVKQQIRNNNREGRWSINNPHELQHYRHPQQKKHRFNLMRRGQHGHLPSRPPNLSYLRRIITSENQILQQRLPATIPLLNCRVIGRLLMLFSLILVPLGTILLFSGMNAKELRFPYGEECKNSRNYLRILKRSCIFCSGGVSPSCTKELEITQDLKTPIYLYYEIENFYQNHRFLIRSVDNLQLRGKVFKKPENPTILQLRSEEMVPIEPSNNCGVYRNDSDGKFYFPCGSMANIMFSDDFTITTAQGYKVPLRNNRIAQPTLREHKFKNPEGITPKNYNNKPIFTKYFVKPRDWTTEVWDEWWKNGGMENERFMNWMVPGHTYTVRKLYAVIDSVPHCADGVLCKGNYSVHIEYRYDVDSFKGGKAIVLSVPSFLGTRNLFTPTFVILIGVTIAALGFRLDRMYELCEIVRKAKKRAESRAKEKKNEHHQEKSKGYPQEATISGNRGSMDVLYVKDTDGLNPNEKEIEDKSLDTVSEHSAFSGGGGDGDGDGDSDDGTASTGEESIIR